MTSNPPAELHAESRLRHLIHASFGGQSKEDVTYAVIREFLLQHKVPPGRFVLYPQLSLRRKPEIQKDDREEIPDFGVGNFTLQMPLRTSLFKMRFGVESKRIVKVMEGLPEPATVQGRTDVRLAFRGLFYQGEDQAKAAIKCGHAPSPTVPYLLFIGPYFAPVTYGPFTPPQLGVRTHKPSDSADYFETFNAAANLESEFPDYICWEQMMQRWCWIHRND